MGLRSRLSEFGSTISRIAPLAPSLQLASATWQLESRHTYQSPRFIRGQPAETPQLAQSSSASRFTVGAFGTLPKPANYVYAYPDLLTFHDAPTVIEQKLFVMFLEHRMRTFQGTFHANPDYAIWYGWSEMRRDLTEIQAMAEDLRHQKASASPR